MSDTVFDFGTSFDTLVQPAGDAASMAALDESAGLDMTPAAASAGDAANGADLSGAADAGNAVDTEPPAVPAQLGDQTDTGIDPSEKPPVQAPVNDASAPAQAPVTDLSTKGPASVTDISTPASSKGIIDSIAQATKDNPAAANIVGKMLAGGATGAMTALALRNKLQAAREAEERARQDTIRRGQVPVLAPGTFTPKPAGIINSRSA